MRFMREPPVAARRVFGVVSRRDSNWVRAAVFEHRFGQHLLQLRIFLLQLLEPFGIGQIHLAVFLAPAMERGFGDVVRLANVFDGLIGFGLP